MRPNASCRSEGPWVGDILFAALIAAVLAVLIPIVPGGPHTAVGTAAALALAVVQGGALIWMRRHPERAMAVVILAGLGLQILGPHLPWFGLASAPMITFSMLRPPRVTLWALGILIVPTPWVLASGGGWRDLLLAIAGPALSWSLGELARTRFLRRDAERRRIIAEERARIARELHDVVAHTVSVIVVQAAAAEDVFDARPERAREALGGIQAAARTALSELRTLLSTMRPEESDEPNAPQPGLAQLDSLAAPLRAAGLTVVLRTEGSAGPMPPGVDLSAYRIVQESLTNTLRHAHATRADVTVRYAPLALQLEIADDGTTRSAGGAATSGTRHGIVGMRERARLLGGTLDAGPGPRGGFLVRAHLPLSSAR
ncbi:sensor histidine kinase [Rugosimonospora acidiphila]|uniref:sensor histidine kinase n=1 Tax=Rugosimonospora acidiphila TaxID=556531 RepID=UPI0031EE264E